MRECVECKVFFKGKSRYVKFCSYSCSSKNTNRRIVHPVYFKECLECGRSFRIKEKRKKFCNQSCGAKFNNKKRGISERCRLRTTCSCGGKKDHRAVLCVKCKKIKTYERRKLLTIRDALCKGNARIKYSHIRKMAGEFLEASKREKKCEICGFVIVVQVCHIKKISDFSEDALVGEVNSLDNLKYLCPNHHVMLDKGLLGDIFKKKDF